MDPIIILLRLIVPLSIFHFPLFGGLASMFLDGIDWSVNFFGIANLHAHYVAIDKILDFYYFSIEAWMVLKWKSKLAKEIGLGLFVLRVVGTILLLVTGRELWLFFFPNVFENFFLFYFAVKFFLKKEPRLSTIALWISVTILAIPKLIQEYIMHVQLVSNWRYVIIPGTNLRYDNIVGQLIIGILLVLFVTRNELKKKKAQSPKT